MPLDFHRLCWNGLRLKAESPTRANCYGRFRAI
jgi:hypothetical protein